MRWRLFPRDHALVELITASAEHVVGGADLLAQLLGAPADERSVLAERLSVAEREADESTEAVLRRVQQSFVTPFDRQDVHDLAVALDDCMDHLLAVGELAVLHRLPAFPDTVDALVRTLQRLAELTAAAMPQLGSLHGLDDYRADAHRLTEAAARHHRRLTAQVLGEPEGSSAENPVLAALRLMAVVDALGRAAAAFEDVSRTVSKIALKDA